MELSEGYIFYILSRAVTADISIPDVRESYKGDADSPPCAEGDMGSLVVEGSPEGIFSLV